MQEQCLSRIVHRFFNYFISDSSNKDTHYRTDKVEEAIGKVGQCGYNDGVIRKMKDGKFERNAIGQPAGVVRPGYSKEFLEEYVKQTGERYKVTE